MGLTGFTATLFLLSLGTYPVVEARIASLPFPAILLGLLLALLLLNSLAGYRVVLTGYDKRIFGASTFLAIWLALVTAASSAAFGHAVDTHGFVGIGYMLAFPLLALIFKRLKSVWLLSALLAGCVLALTIGYIRFITLSGGTPSEHALLYWGIKYLPSTRNSDVLYAIVSSLAASGLYAITRTRAIKGILMVVIIASFAAVILSLSRGAWIALATGYAALLWLTKQQHIIVRKRGQAIGVIVLVAIVVATWFNSNETYPGYDVIVDRLQSIADIRDPRASNRERLDIAMDAIDGILRYPTGVGVGNAAYALGRPMDANASAENAWLTIGLEGGWLAMAAFSLLLLWLLVSAKPMHPPRNTAHNDVLSTTGTALSVAICTYLMFNYELNSLFLWSVLAVIWALKGRVNIAINRQDLDPDGGVQCAGHNC
jgi:O-antigen ligase